MISPSSNMQEDAVTGNTTAQKMVGRLIRCLWGAPTISVTLMF